MRTILTALAVLLSAAAVTAPARAQSPTSPRPSSPPGSGSVYGPYSVYGPGLTYRQPSFYAGPYATSLRAQTSVTVPDRGEALVAGYRRLSEGRNEFGAPVLGKTPYLNRGFKNVGSGRSISRTTLSARVRVIILAEEEERQTGLRP
jgi:hypothetical protein